MTYADQAALIAEDVAALGNDADREVAALLAITRSHEDTIAALRARIAQLTTVTPPPPPPPPVDPPPVVPPVTTKPRLRYAPPPLVDPLTFDLTPTARKAMIPGDRDAVVRIPAALRNVAGGIEINGGRNVRLVGGEIEYSGVQVSRALYIKGVTGGQPGNVHIEGLLFSGTSINGDAIDVDCQGQRRTITLQNIDVAVTLAGSYTGNHSDAFQVWNGPNRLRVDGMIVRNARYQGFFLDPKKFQSGIVLDDPGVELHNLHIPQGPEHGYALFNASAGRAVGSNVRVRHGSTAANRVGYPAGAWPFAQGYFGDPDPDDRFLSGVPGMGYVSPGYL